MGCQCSADPAYRPGSAQWQELELGQPTLGDLQSSCCNLLHPTSNTYMSQHLYLHRSKDLSKIMVSQFKVFHNDLITKVKISLATDYQHSRET